MDGFVGQGDGKLDDCIRDSRNWSESSSWLVQGNWSYNFDVKMDFTRKARWVKDGYKDPDSIAASFAGVVSWESIRIVLTYAGLLGLPVIGSDIKNAYL